MRRFVPYKKMPNAVWSVCGKESANMPIMYGTAAWTQVALNVVSTKGVPDAAR
jgi:hypothetical protein